MVSSDTELRRSFEVIYLGFVTGSRKMRPGFCDPPCGKILELLGLEILGF